MIPEEWYCTVELIEKAGRDRNGRVSKGEVKSTAQCLIAPGVMAEYGDRASSVIPAQSDTHSEQATLYAPPGFAPRSTDDIRILQPSEFAGQWEVMGGAQPWVGAGVVVAIKRVR